MSNLQEAATIAWDVNLALRMQGTGMSLTQIAAVFGLTHGTVHCRIDPAYRERRLELVNRRRQAITEANVRTQREREVAEQEARTKSPQFWELTSPEGAELRIKAITVREIAASHPVGKSARWQRVPVSLPYLPFLYGEAR